MYFVCSEEIHKAVRAVISQYFADLKEGEPKKAGSSRVSVELKKSDKDIKKPFFWHIKADNGEIVLRSQMYAAEGAAIMDLVSVCVYGGVKANYELKSTKNGEFHFHINAQRNEIVGTSQTFTTLSDGKKGIDGVQEKIRVILSAIVDPETAEEQLQAQEQPKREQRKPKQQDQISEQLHPKLLPTNTVQHASPQVPARQGQAQATQAQVHGGQGQVHAQAATKQQGDRDGNDVTDDDSDTDIENVDKDDDQ